MPTPAPSSRTVPARSRSSTRIVTCTVGLALGFAGCGSECSNLDCGAELIVVASLDPGLTTVEVELCREDDCSSASVSTDACTPVHPELEAVGCLTPIDDRLELSVDAFLTRAGEPPRQDERWSARVTDPDSGAVVAEGAANVSYEPVAPNVGCAKTECETGVLTVPSVD